MRLDKQFNVVTPQEPMMRARFGSPLALVHQRFILALGGFISLANEQTSNCEAFDTETNHWFEIAPMPFPISNTNAVVMNDSKVYIMPG